MADGRLLRIYLNDHFALATSAVHLCRRMAAENEGTDLGRALARILAELEEERRTLERVIASLGHRPSRTKQAAVVVGERVARLKLNGRLRSYSPLSRLLELEGFAALLEFQVALWRTLAVLPGLAGRLDVDLDGLAVAAENRRDELVRFRPEAVRAAFAER